MKDINIKTKFDIGDIVYGFPDKELHEFKIDRIEVSTAKFGWIGGGDKTNIKIIYLATTTDAEFNAQNKFTEEQLFTKEELKDYINNYFIDKEIKL